MMNKIFGYLLFVAILFSAPTVNALTIDVTLGSSPFGYMPLSGFGVTPIAGMGDDDHEYFSIPAFSYAGETWDTLGVSSNGFLVAGGPSGTSFNNIQFPNLSQPNNILAPFWTDLNPGAGGGVYIAALTSGSNTWIVTDWNDVPLLSDFTKRFSFEVWIGINGVEDISFVYGALSSTPTSLTIGAEDKTGTVGDNYYFDGSGLMPTSGTELRVTTTGSPVPEPSTFLLLGGGLVGLALAVRRRRKE